VLTPDVERFIARRFIGSEREAASALCRSATIHDSSSAGPRLIRCALVASGGSLERLRAEIEHLKIDYRDVIMAGEYISRDGEPVRVRNLNEPIEDEA
jgi:hypothetical protein